MVGVKYDGLGEISIRPKSDEKSERRSPVAIDISVAFLPLSRKPHGQDVLFFADFDPIEKKTLRVQVIGMNTQRGSFRVERVDFRDTIRPLTVPEARGLCQAIDTLLSVAVAPRIVRGLTTGVLDTEVQPWRRSK